MVKVGFIVEGDTEKIIVESPAFVAWLQSQQIELCSPVVDAKGGGNLLPQNIDPMVNRLREAQAEHIVILTDLEDAISPDVVRSRIGTEHADLIFIAVKAIEAWFLADSQALRKWLGLDDVAEDRPEETVGMPWDRLKELAKEKAKQGPGSNKPGFAKKMVKHYGFTVANAAQHPHCPSAKEFHDGLQALNSHNDPNSNH
ncbi:DUF4276 family protein [Andreprevotia chitinilytica]|uniref:DUF4276 family protein n=1 Tax=Andreprevotia chitinilytica TaxID=396808 RepID=UPI000A070ECD|nr:hypothetical protein [Andreprevotia chitinilytica]